jgi:glucokinase
VIVVGAIDIGGTKIAVGVIDDEGRILEKLERPTEPERGFQDGLQRMQQMLKECVQTAGVPIRGIGVGSAGPIDPFTGIYGRVDNLATWEGSNLMEPLEREFGVRVAVENDGDAAALAEEAWGVGRGKSRFIYVTISTGIGGGMVLDGELYRGVDNAHPEVGHFVIEASGPVCYCGARGCWEFLAAGPAMVAWMRANAPPDLTLPSDLSAKEICRRAEEGDSLAKKAVEQEAYYIGVGLSNLIMMFCPDVIALGGGVMNSAHLFMDRVRQVIRQNCTLVPAAKTELLLASMGADTGLAGAARAWYNRFGKKPR